MEREAVAEIPSPGPVVASLNAPWLRDSLSYFGSKIVPGLMGLISVPIFIRLIGLDEYGRLAVIIPLLMAVAGAGSGWLAQGILRFHPLESDSPDAHLAFKRAVIRGAMLSVIVTCFALCAILAGLRYSIATCLVATAFCLSLLSYTVLLSKLQAQLQPKSLLQREVVRSIGALVIPVAIVLIAGSKQFEFVLLGQAIAYTIAMLPGLRFLPQITLEDTRPAPAHAFQSEKIIRRLWTFGWAVGLWLLLSQLLPVIDRWAIQRFAGFASAGVYASLYEISIRSFSFMVFPLTQAAHPRIMRAWNEGRFTESYMIIRHSITSQFAIFVVALVGGAAFARPLTRIILGIDDPVAVRMVPVLVVGGFLWQLALLLHKPLEIAQRTTSMLAGLAGVVVFNIISCLFFIPRFGYSAASYILMFSAGLYIVFTLCVTRFAAFRRLAHTAGQS
ncbi:MAG TPA: lipopolysaccharide biosynthesis protein [Candidatus Sulfotelmatobacter sp.]|jgi:O-antigen/teichoic acid export membrane protein